MPSSNPLKFEHYEVQQLQDGSPVELGRGAMGITYKAFDTNLRCEVALKVITPNLLDQGDTAQRFMREARLAATLRHPNVASVSYLGNVASQYFYVMEYIEGEDLKAQVETNGPLALAQALDITLQVAKALTAAEKQNLIHRDIKPANIMLVRDEGELHVKLIDFGLAKPSQADGSVWATRADAGFLGTPLFASPEQITEQQLDIRSDIYALGMTLWFMLTGSPPFTGSLAEVLSGQLHDEPPWDALPALPESVTGLLRRMTEKNPAHRPQTAAELRRMIAECLAEIAPTQFAMQTGTLPAGAEYFEDAATILPRHLREQEAGQSGARKLLIGGGVALGLLIGAGSYMAWKSGRDNPEPPGPGPGPLPAQVTEASAADLLRDAKARASDDPLKAVSLLVQLGHEHANSPEAAEAGTLIREWLENLVAAETPLPPAGIRAAEQDLRFLANSHLAPAMILLGRAAEPDDPPAAAKWLLDAGRIRESEGAIRAAAELYTAAYMLAPDDPVGREAGQKVLVMAGRMDRGQPGYGNELAAVLEPGVKRLAEGSDPAAMEWMAGRSPGPAWHQRLIEAYAKQQDWVNTVTWCDALADRYQNDFKDETAAAVTRASEILAVRLDQPPTAVELARAAAILEHLAEAHAVVPAMRLLGDHYAATSEPAKGAAWLIRAGDELAAGQATGEAAALYSRALSLAPKGPGAEPAAAKIRGLMERTTGNSEWLAALLPGVTRLAGQEDIPAMQFLAVHLAAKDAKQSLEWAGRLAALYSGQGDWKNTIDTWAAAAERFEMGEPFNAAAESMDRLIATFREGARRLSPEQFTALQPQITRAAKLNVGSAMMLLGERLRTSDAPAALKWFEEAAETGLVDAMIQAGLMHANGEGTGDRNLRKAYAWFNSASITQTSAKADFLLAECYLFGKGVEADPTRAVSLLQRAVDMDFAPAMDTLGICYRKGVGVAQDIPKAVSLLQRAVKADNPDSYASLAVIYMIGDGVEASPARALELLQQGADKHGNAASMFWLGMAHHDGNGTPANPAEGKRWILKSAKAGYEPAVKWCMEQGISL